MSILAVTLVDYTKSDASGEPLEVGRLAEREKKMLRAVLLTEIMIISSRIKHLRWESGCTFETKEEIFLQPDPPAKHEVKYRQVLFTILNRLDGGDFVELGNARLLIGFEQATHVMLVALRQAIVKTIDNPFRISNVMGTYPVASEVVRESLDMLLQFMNKAIDLSTPA